MDGPLRTGAGEAAGFVAQVADLLRAELGFDPVYGTLNVEAAPPEPSIRLDGLGDDHCDGVDLTPCYVFGVRAAAIRPLVPGYPDRKVELVAPVHLRTLFDIDPGDSVEMRFDGPPRPAGAPAVDGASLDSFDAVVLDAAVAADASLDVFGGQDCRVVLREPTVGAQPPAAPADAVDAVVDGGDAADLRDCFDRLDVCTGNSVVLTDSEAGAELAHEAGTSVLRGDWISSTV